MVLSGTRPLYQSLFRGDGQSTNSKFPLTMMTYVWGRSLYVDEISWERCIQHVLHLPFQHVCGSRQMVDDIILLENNSTVHPI